MARKRKPKPKLKSRGGWFGPGDVAAVLASRASIAEPDRAYFYDTASSYPRRPSLAELARNVVHAYRALQITHGKGFQRSIWLREGLEQAVVALEGVLPDDPP